MIISHFVAFSFFKDGTTSTILSKSGHVPSLKQTLNILLKNYWISVFNKHRFNVTSSFSVFGF